MEKQMSIIETSRFRELRVLCGQYRAAQEGLPRGHRRTGRRISTSEPALPCDHPPGLARLCRAASTTTGASGENGRFRCSEPRVCSRITFRRFR